MNKYKLSEETLEINGHILHRIIALRSFGNVNKGELGGWIEKESNLSHEGDCWIYNDAVVFDNAKIRGNAKIINNAKITDNALIYDNARVTDRVRVYDNAKVCGNAKIGGNAVIKDKSDYIVFKNWWSSGRYFTWTRSNNMWKVGCFLGTGEELIRRAYADNSRSGREYARIVKYVESEIDK